LTIPVFYFFIFLLEIIQKCILGNCKAVQHLLSKRGQTTNILFFSFFLSKIKIKRKHFQCFSSFYCKFLEQLGFENHFCIGNHFYFADKSKISKYFLRSEHQMPELYIKWNIPQLYREVTATRFVFVILWLVYFCHVDLNKLKIQIVFKSSFVDYSYLYCINAL